MTCRRWKKMAVSEQMLGEVLRMRVPGRWYRVVSDGLPADARVVGVRHNPVTTTWWIVWESEEWPDVPECASLEDVSQFTPTVEERVFPEDS